MIFSIIMSRNSEENNSKTVRDIQILEKEILAACFATQLGVLPLKSR